jgi:hypothetical protein
MTTRPFYVTTFCNFAHYLDTGRPIGHECYIIPPRLLEMERTATTYEAIWEAWRPWYANKGPLVRGRHVEGD